MKQINFSHVLVTNLKKKKKFTKIKLIYSLSLFKIFENKAKFEKNEIKIIVISARYN